MCVLKHFYANTPIQWWFNAIFCMPRQIKLNNLHFNCLPSLIVVTTNHNVFRHKSLRIICGWIYAGYSEILCDTLYNRAANCRGLWVMRVTSWPPAFPDCHLLLVFQHSVSPQARQYPKYKLQDQFYEFWNYFFLKSMMGNLCWGDGRSNLKSALCLCIYKAYHGFLNA